MTGKVIIGDCFEIMEKMEPKSIDAILTSPPFKDEDVPREYYSWYKEFLSLAERVTRDYALIFNSSTRLVELCRLDPKPDRILIWNKVSTKTAFRYEPILVYEFSSARYEIGDHIWVNIISKMTTPKNEHPDHPDINPVELYLYLLRYLAESQTILDPFAGSGTTGVAAKRLGKDFILIEKNPEYEELIKKRLAFGTLEEIFK